MAMWYWSVAILFWQLSIDHIVNGQCKRCGFAKTCLRHPSLPFDSLPYPTRTICRRVRTYVRSVNHVTTKRKEVDHILWVWGSVPRALRTRWSPANIRIWGPHDSGFIAYSEGAFHLSELTGQTIPVVMRISLLITTIELDQSKPKYSCTKEMGFQQNLLGKSYFIVKMTAPAMARPTSSDVWKVLKTFHSGERIHKVADSYAGFTGHVWMEAVSERKMLRIQKYPDTCGPGLSHASLSQSSFIVDWPCR